MMKVHSYKALWKCVRYSYEMLCTIWYHLYNLKNVKKSHGRVLLLKVCSFTKSSTPPWVFFMIFKLYKWYQIAQRITNVFLWKNAFLSTWTVYLLIVNNCFMQRFCQKYCLLKILFTITCLIESFFRLISDKSKVVGELPWGSD